MDIKQQNREIVLIGNVNISRDKPDGAKIDKIFALSQSTDP